MPEEAEQVLSDTASSPGWRGLRVRYALLTAALFVPLVASFVFVRNLYPFAASNMMMEGGGLGRGLDYYVLRGETASGETFDLAPVTLTDALRGRHWGLVGATVRNGSFTIRRPHYENLRLLGQTGGGENLPAAARLPELLRAWGEIHNEVLPADSPRRLKAVRLDAYRWDGRRYSDYEQFVRSWRVEL